MQATDTATSPLDRLVAAVLESPRYRSVCPDAVRRLGARELASRKSWKEAERETRSRLHQIGGAYLDARPPYARWIEALRQAPDEAAYRAELRRMMRAHASTEERLATLDTFYERTLHPLRPIRSIVDLGCGLNPLALPWMGLEPGGRYEGYDLYSDLAAFLEEALAASRFAPPMEARMGTVDLVDGPPPAVADVALILKLLPLLGHAGPEETLGWLQRIGARYLLVSFPTRTLGGRNVGMARTYASRFREVIQGAGWREERFELSNELCFLIEKGCGETDRDGAASRPDRAATGACLDGRK